MAADTRSSWWLYNFVIDEALLGVNADEFCDGLRVEGVPAMRQYLERPLFEEEVIQKRRTFGNSGYPLSAVDYTPPKREDLPGLDEFFRRQIIVSWNSRMKTAHVEGIARAVEKLLPTRAGCAGAGTCPDHRPSRPVRLRTRAAWVKACWRRVGALKVPPGLSSGW
jgi:dTDP-4-amino-4,6-dideoxygalactose transaminase